MTTMRERADEFYRQSPVGEANIDTMARFAEQETALVRQTHDALQREIDTMRHNFNAMREARDALSKVNNELRDRIVGLEAAKARLYDVCNIRGNATASYLTQIDDLKYNLMKKQRAGTILRDGDYERILTIPNTTTGIVVGGAYDGRRVERVTGWQLIDRCGEDKAHGSEKSEDSTGEITGGEGGERGVPADWFVPNVEYRRILEERSRYAGPLAERPHRAAPAASSDASGDKRPDAAGRRCEGDAADRRRDGGSWGSC